MKKAVFTVAFVLLVAAFLSDCVPISHGNAEPAAFGPMAGMEFVRIPSGSFSMGSDCGDTDELPIHTVYIESFDIMTTEVTQGMWEEVMGITVEEQSLLVSPFLELYGEGDTYPIYYVSWTDCQNFIKRMDELDTGYTYRLPTEAEWEYACRAGSQTEYYWGDDDSNTKMDIYCWYDDNSDSNAHQVRQKEPNGWGLYDMTGNVFEWCEDNYHDNYDTAPVDGTAWLDSESEYRIIRGGASNTSPYYCRSAFRGAVYYDDRLYELGFRLIRE